MLSDDDINLHYTLTDCTSIEWNPGIRGNSTIVVTDLVKGNIYKNILRILKFSAFSSLEFA